MWRFRNYRLLAEDDDPGAGGDPAAAGGDGDDAAGGDGQGGGMLRETAGKGKGGEDPPAEEDDDKVTDASDGRLVLETEDGKKIPLPDQFWDADNNQPRVDALFKSQRDTREALRKASEEKQQLEQQLSEARGTQGKVPDSPDGYEFKPPEGREVADDDAVLSTFKEIAHANGVPQEQFQALAGQFMEKLDDLIGDPIDPEAERKALGENAGKVLESVASWVNSFRDQGLLSEAEHDEILSIGETAAGVRALNKLREAMGEQPIPVDTAGFDELPSKQEWYQMVASDRYAQDPAYRQKVDKMGERIFGTAEAGTSEPGLGVG